MKSSGKNWTRHRSNEENRTAIERFTWSVEDLDNLQFLPVALVFSSAMDSLHVPKVPKVGAQSEARSEVFNGRPNLERTREKGSELEKRSEVSLLQARQPLNRCIRWENVLERRHEQEKLHWAGNTSAFHPTESST